MDWSKFPLAQLLKPAEETNFVHFLDYLRRVYDHLMNTELYERHNSVCQLYLNQLTQSRA